MTEIQIPFRSGRIAVLGDLHLDHWVRADRNPLRDFKLEELLTSDLDALIIAGDLVNGPPTNLSKAGQTVIVTHHGPHPEVAGNIDELTPAFLSDLSEIFEQYDIDAWFFGHSHRHHRASISCCDVRNISIGYPEERHNRLGYLEDACLWDSRHGS